MTLTDALLRHAQTLRFEDLSADAVAATRVFLMDSLAVGISGSGPQVPLTAAIRASAASYGAGNAARAWVTGERLPAASAAISEPCPLLAAPASSGAPVKSWAPLTCPSSGA